jgi:serine protease Do
MDNSGQEEKIAGRSVVPIAIILSGPRRGHTEILSEKSYLIALDAEENVYFHVPDGESDKDFHAILHRYEDTYEIEVAPDHNIWVSGQQVRESQILKPGDLLEIGHKGPVVRYRMYSNGLTHRKKISELVSDCFNGAQVDGVSRFNKTTRFLRNIFHDITTQTTLWFRIWILFVITLLVISFVYLVMQNMKLQKHVATGDIRIESIEEELLEHDAKNLNQQALSQLQAEVESQLASTFERIEQLETSSGNASEIILKTSPSVVFLLGTYSYINPDTGLFFRYAQSAKGSMKRYTFDENAKVFEIPFTGTAFVISSSGLLLTNKHVIEPWRESHPVEIIQGRNLTPVLHHIYAYYPDATEAIEVTDVYTSDLMDLTLLRTTGSIEGVQPLVFQSRVPNPGDEVLLLGYPTGIRALVARASREFHESIEYDQVTDHAAIANWLSASGNIKPLATRGIVGQITNNFIVYDAETTFGGSGGPVLDQHGKVIAVNAALIPDFAGSNMGVPAQHAQYFLEQKRNWKKISNNE